MQITKIATDYAADVATEDMLALLDYENVFTGGARTGDARDDDVLFRKLAKIDGVDSVDYDGHFGACVFFTIETQFDTPATHAAVLAAIEAHLVLARAHSLRARETAPAAP